MKLHSWVVAVLLAFPFCINAQQVSLADPARLSVSNATAVVTTHLGSPALKLVPVAPGPSGAADTGPLAILNGIRFRNGVIDVDVSGEPVKDADPSARGFIGVVFRVQSASRFELIYLRPTNSTADDQLRRNHSTQYSSAPDWPWERLRKESPGVYESWVDLATGKWTHMRIVVSGTNASLYVNGAANPCLIVHDLKLGDSEGAIGLWMGRDTDGYFRNLKVTRE